MTDETTRKHMLSYIGGESTRASQPGVRAAHDPEEERASEPWSLLWAVLAAHVVELRRAEVIDDRAFAVVANSLSAARGAAAGSGSTRSLAEELGELVESRLPMEVRGVATLGLAREEWLATVARLAWREAHLGVLKGVVTISDRVQVLAETHVVTMMPAYIAGRPAQPTTLAHFLGGLIGPLVAVRSRLAEGFTRLNRSPLGAALLAGDVLDADRDDLAQRLGFDGIVHNTLDAVASVEDYVEAIDGAAAALSTIGRFLGEILTWVRTDPTSFVLDDAWIVRPEPGQPAYVAPSRLEELGQSIRAEGERLDGIRRSLRSLEYGPLGSGHDLVLSAALETSERVHRALAETVDFFETGLIVNRAWLGNRAGRDHSTAGDLATFLMAEEQVAPADAQRIATLVLSRLREANLEVSGITQDMIDSAALMTIGQELKVEMETLGRYLAPRRFLERRRVTGSPAPDMARAWLASERQHLERDREWLAATSSAVRQAIERLRASVDEVAGEPPES